MRISEFVFLFAILGATALVGTPQTASDTSNQKVEYTPGLDLNSLDRSADPCVDFYQFACGSWLKNNPIPPDQTSWGQDSKLQEQNRLILRGILEDSARPSPTRTPVEQKIGDYYASCMDESAVEAAGIKPLRSDLERIAGLKSVRELAAYLASYHERDVFTVLPTATLFSFTSDQDFKDSTQYIPEADQGGIGLPDRDYYTKEDAKSQEIRKGYLAHVQKMFELLGDKPDVAAANAQTVMRLETALARGSMTRVQRRDPASLYHKMTRAELQGITPSLDWNAYLAGVGLASAQSLNVVPPEFFKTLEQELKSESLDAWKTYLRWHLAHSNARYLPAAFVNADFEFFSKTMGGQKELQPRWKRCVRFVDRDLGEALSQIYVQKTFGAEGKQRTMKMVEEIEAAMDRDIHQLPWMSETTKQQALEKLHLIRNKIGYPDKWRDYSSVVVGRDDALGNVQRSVTFEFHRQLNKIGKPIDRGEWQITPATVNAYYNPQMNDINFPAGILQPPFFDKKMDDAVNYGDIGGIIGHELTHGFDDEGRQFDGHGNLRDWWTAADGKEFEKRASCVSDQYLQYTVVDDIKINGQLTLGEDVADLGGLTLALMAWQEATKGQKLAPIDGFTPEQRFFLGYGQGWCTNETPERLRMRAAMNPHSPDKYRANGVVSNTPEFQRAFGCKAGQPMVRANQCRVW
ncbi:MAG TPA: M13 family metallopeptidase [Terriglobales bacterium]|nr:M13 family metallopeptidase [Terriglobales bacterium]